MHCGKVLENIPGRKTKKSLTCKPQEDIPAQYIEDITCLSKLLSLGSKFSGGALPTMHLIYVYTDIYQRLKIFANSCIYIYIYTHTQYINWNKSILLKK